MTLSGLLAHIPGSAARLVTPDVRGLSCEESPRLTVLLAEELPPRYSRERESEPFTSEAASSCHGLFAGAMLRNSGTLL